MNRNPDARFRIRFLLLAIIVATLPCYCGGLVLARLAQNRVPVPVIQPVNQLQPFEYGLDAALLFAGR